MTSVVCTARIIDTRDKRALSKSERTLIAARNLFEEFASGCRQEFTYPTLQCV